MARITAEGAAAVLVFATLTLLAGLAPALSHGSPPASTVAGRDCLACHTSIAPSPAGGMEAGSLRGGLTGAPWVATVGLLAGLSLALAATGLLAAARTIARGRSPRGRVEASIRGLIVDALLQARLLKSRQDATVHLPIYLGAALLAVAGLMFLAKPAWSLSPYAGHQGYYTLFRLLSNAGAALLLAGVAWAAERRLLGLRGPLETTLDDALALAALAAVAATGMLVDAGSAVAHAAVSWSDPASVLLQGLWGNVAAEAYPWAYSAALLAHLASVTLLAASLGWGRLRHLALAPASLTLRRAYMPAAAEPVPDAEKLADEKGYIGAQHAGDLSWRMRLDYQACTRCALCTSLCPAYASGRPLSPMHLVQAMRRAVETEEEQLVPAVVKPETLWSCTTCGACLHACPVGVHHVETITELRRGLVSTGENVPEELLQVSYSLMRTGNPYGSDPYEREQWLQQLADKGLLEIAEPGKEYDLLLWVGCANAYDPRLRGVVESLLRLLKRAGLRVAAAPGQQCCGEPARRIGDELMFQELVRMNTEELQQYRFKRILVTCPHGLHVLRHEYPQHGAPRWDVVHHTQLLAELIQQGRLQPAKKLDKPVTYHDPCYLARWNKITEEPRQALKTAARELREMRRNRHNTFCCGGGGGGVFYDPKIGKRPARTRIEEAKATGAEILAVACPFCNIMLSAEAPDYDIEVKDVAQLLDEATEGGQ